MIISLVSALLLAGLGSSPSSDARAVPRTPAPAVAAPAPQVDQAKPANADPPGDGQTKRTSRRKPPQAAPGTFERSRRPRDGGPSRKVVSAKVNVMAGYDDNLTAALGSGSGASPTAMVSGATASVDGTLAYLRGNSRRSFGIDASGSLMGYPGNLDEPAPGGGVSAEARVPVGRSLSVLLSERASYEPLFNVLSPASGAGPLPPDAGQPPANAGLFERNSWSSASGASLEGRWGREDTTTLGYVYRLQEFTDEDAGDNHWHELTAGHRRLLSPLVKAGVDYRYGSGEYAASNGSVRPTVRQRLEGVAEFTGASSRRRSYSLLVAAGAGYLESTNGAGARYDSWLPVGRARVTFDATSNWRVGAGYQRQLSLLQGVTDDVYTTDSVSANATGLLTNGISLQVGATYSNWITTVASGVNDTMGVYGASAGLRVLLSRSMAATGGYYYYFHRYSNPASLPAGFPARYDRQAVRVGLTLYFPLAGSPSSPLNRW